MTANRRIICEASTGVTTVFCWYQRRRSSSPEELRQHLILWYGFLSKRNAVLTERWEGGASVFFQIIIKLLHKHYSYFQMLWFLSAQQSASVSFSVLFSFYSHQHFHQTVGYLYRNSGAFLAKEPLSSLRNWMRWTQLQINDHAASPGGRCSSTNRPKSWKYWWIIVLRRFFWVMDWLMSLSLLFFSHWE